MLSRRNPDGSETSSRKARVQETLSVRPVVTILVLLVNVVWYNFCTYFPFDQLDFCINFCVSMDRLPPETQEQLKKMSSTRLVLKLGKAGFDPDRLEELGRADLLEAMAESMLAEPTAESETDFFREAREASQVSLPAGHCSGTTSEGGSAAVRLRELELEEKRAERKKRQAEREERRVARKAEKRKAVREAEERERREQRAMESKERRRELEATVARDQAERNARLKAKQLKLEHEICRVELKACQVKPGDGEGVDGQTPSDPSGAGN